MINPQELQNAGFSKGLNGYKCSEVDSYVEYVVEQYSELFRENAELEKRIKLLTAKLEDAKKDQNSISATIVNAQKMADEIIRDANEKANAINAAITESFDAVVAQYREIIAIERKNLAELQQSAVEFKAKMLDGYKSQVKQICDLIPIDSADDINLKTVDEIVENTIAEAGAKLGVTSDTAPETDDNETENSEN